MPAERGESSKGIGRPYEEEVSSWAEEPPGPPRRSPGLCIPTGLPRFRGWTETPPCQVD